MVFAAQDIEQDALTLADDTDAMIARAEALIGNVGKGAGIIDAWVDGGALYDAIGDILSGRGKPPYLTTGYSGLDEVMGGLRQGRLSILGGRPAMGKSAVAVEIMKRIAKAGYGAGMFSLEMDISELALRMGCGEAYDHYGGANPIYFAASSGRLTGEQELALVEGGDMLRRLPIFFDDRTGLRPSQIIPAAKRLIRRWEKQKINPGVIIIDHLHIVKPDQDRHGNRAAEVGDVSYALACLAKETGVPVLALCQLSREVESRKNADKRPQMSDLRWSGEIEQDANTITFVYRPEYYLREPADKDAGDHEWADYHEQKEKWANKILFLIEKNRGGPRGEHMMSVSLPHNALWEGAGHP
jgi:replicative DNA helicase